MELFGVFQFLRLLLVNANLGGKMTPNQFFFGLREPQNILVQLGSHRSNKYEKH